MFRYKAQFNWVFLCPVGLSVGRGYSSAKVTSLKELLYEVAQTILSTIIGKFL